MQQPRAVADSLLIVRHWHRPGTAGRPFRHVDLRIVAEDGGVLPPGAIGEIAVRTPTVIAGYIGRGRLGPDQLDADGFYRTGDLGHVDDDGYLFISDRRTDLVISGGTNIYPAEIEAVLHRHPAVALAAVIGVPHPEHGEEPIAVVEPAPGAHPTAEELLAFCADRLAPYKRPRRVEFVGALPLNPMGKVLRREVVSSGRTRAWINDTISRHVRARLDVGRFPVIVAAHDAGLGASGGSPAGGPASGFSVTRRA